MRQLENIGAPDITSSLLLVASALAGTGWLLLAVVVPGSRFVVTAGISRLVQGRPGITKTYSASAGDSPPALGSSEWSDFFSSLAATWASSVFWLYGPSLAVDIGLTCGEYRYNHWGKQIRNCREYFRSRDFGLNKSLLSRKLFSREIIMLTWRTPLVAPLPDLGQLSRCLPPSSSWLSHDKSVKKRKHKSA